MRTLIVNTNRHRTPFPVLPAGACMVADAAAAAGHETNLLDLTFERRPLRRLASAVARTRPAAVGLSVRNIDNNDMLHTATFFAGLRPLIDTIRAVSDAEIVLGGAALGVMPEALLRFSGARWAVLGDGEVVLPRLLDALERGDDPRGIDGVAWTENGRFFANARRSPLESRHLAPDYDRWLRLGPYRRRLCTVPIQTKRGCPFACTYCTYPLNEGRSYRLHDPAAVVEAVGAMVARGMPDIDFADNVFNAPHDHALAICEELARRPAKGRLSTMEMNPRFVTNELLAAMERAGFIGHAVTAESAADPVLEGLGKGYTRRELDRAAAAVAKSPLPALWIFLLGGPGETRETVAETLDFARGIRPTDVAFFNIGVRIYPATGIERIARREGVLTKDPADMLEPVFYVSPRVEEGWIRRTLKRCMDERLNLVGPDSINFPHLPLIQRLMYALGVSRPFWRHTPRIRSMVRLAGWDL